MARTYDTIVILVQRGGPAIHLVLDGLGEAVPVQGWTGTVGGEEIVRGRDGACHRGGVRAVFDAELRCEQLRIQLVDAVAGFGDAQDGDGLSRRGHLDALRPALCAEPDRQQRGDVVGVGLPEADRQRAAAGGPGGHRHWNGDRTADAVPGIGDSDACCVVHRVRARVVYGPTTRV